MPTAPVSPCKSPGENLSSPRTPVGRDTLALDRNGTQPTSVGSDGSSKIRIIGIAVEAHKSLKEDGFSYALNHLIERGKCKVVVISCLSQLQSPMGVDYKIDTASFAGINRRILDQEIQTQLQNLNYFLRSFRASLKDREVVLDIRITAGPKSDQILIQAARALQPHWIVLDRSFSRHEKTLEQELQCNLVIMKKSPKFKVIRLNQKFIGPLDEGEEPLSGDAEEPSKTLETDQQSFHSRNESKTTSILSMKPQDRTRKVPKTTTVKAYVCFPCICFHEEDFPSAEGPSKDKAVIFGETKPGGAPVYLGQIGPPDVVLPVEEPVNLISNSPSDVSTMSRFSNILSHSPSDVSTKSWFANTPTKRSVSLHVRTIEAQMAAAMTKADDDDDNPVWLEQL